MSMKQESAISPVGTVEYMAPEVRFRGERLERRGAVMVADRVVAAMGSSRPVPPGLLHSLASSPHPTPPRAFPTPSSIHTLQVVALPAVDLVISGQIKATDIAPTNEKVDIWALGVTVFELVTGACFVGGRCRWVDGWVDEPIQKRQRGASAALPPHRPLTLHCLPPIHRRHCRRPPAI